MILLNGTEVEVPSPLKEVRLVDFLSDHLGLTGTKFGCGIGQCGACTVHLNGRAERSCQISAGEAEGARVTTIEGLGPSAADSLHPLQKAWIAESVPQCGYCQPGQIMTAAAFLKQNPKPSGAEISDAMNGNLCRCGTYGRIRKAIRRASEGAEK